MRLLRKTGLLILAAVMFLSLIPEQTQASSTKGSDIVSISERFIGTPYQRAGTTPSGFDCSGYVRYVFNEAGISLPRTTGQQFNTGEPVSRNNLRKGDLVFFNTSGNGVSHSGIYVGNNRFIHASTSRGVIITNLDDPHYWGSRYIGARRVFEEKPEPEVKALSTVDFSRGDIAMSLVKELDLSSEERVAFNDVSESSSLQEAVSAVSSNGIMNGVESGTFGADGAVTRAQIASIFVRAFELKGQSSERVPFPDVPDSHWAHHDIQILVSNGLLSGYPDGEYKPGRHISEEEFHIILDRIRGL